VSVQLQQHEPPATRHRSDGRAVALKDVSRSFATADGTVQALGGVSLRAAEGEVLALVGPSGCGKTTLLELVCGLQRPDGGTVDSPPAVLMPQQDLLLPWLDATDNAALALRIAGAPRRAARERAGALFAELGLDGFETARPETLSGGMRQRVAFLRTLLSGKPVLCLDEPFGALDAITRAEMQEWLAAALAREPRTVLLVTHDVEEAVLLADRVLVLSPRPGRVSAELAVHAPRPRRRAREGAGTRGAGTREGRRDRLRGAALEARACPAAPGAAAARTARRLGGLRRQRRRAGRGAAGPP
jgi:ABC-type nitrate/sulfonate/bicarbonate transport system ATPase subunit